MPSEQAPPSSFSSTTRSLSGLAQTTTRTLTTTASSLIPSISPNSTSTSSTTTPPHTPDETDRIYGLTRAPPSPTHESSALPSTTFHDLPPSNYPPPHRKTSPSPPPFNLERSNKWEGRKIYNENSDLPSKTFHDLPEQRNSA